MNRTEFIRPSIIEGTVTVPSSKSMMQRAVAACFLAELFGHQDGLQCKIINPSDCDDAITALKIVKSIRNGEKVLDCGEAGLSLRMFAPIATLFDRKFVLTGHGSLLDRPVDMVETALKSLGVECKSNNGLLPMELKGPLKAGKLTVEASVTSQLLTGLLMALPCCDGDSQIVVKNLKSKPYIEMTLKLLNDFGIEIENDAFKSFKIKGGQKYKTINYSVEGDWSSASFLLVAGAIGGCVKVENLNHHSSFQADKKIIEVLKLCGAGVKIGYENVEVYKKELEAFTFDAQDCPDLFPPLVTLACYCKGKSIISGVERLKHKESNRGIVLQDEFKKLGAKIKISEDKMEIEGTPLNGGKVNSNADHRIAMACAVAGISSKQGVKINGADCVSKSYPGFFMDLDSIIKTD